MAQHNKQFNRYPLPYNLIKRNSRFDQVLGRTKDAYTTEQRKKRWEKLLSFSKANRQYWLDASKCTGCKNLNTPEAWCTLMDMPCTVNPILTYQLGTKSMACKGEGYELDPSFKPGHRACRDESNQYHGIKLWGIKLLSFFINLKLKANRHFRNIINRK